MKNVICDTNATPEMGEAFLKELQKHVSPQDITCLLLDGMQKPSNFIRLADAMGVEGVRSLLNAVKAAETESK